MYILKQGFSIKTALTSEILPVVNMMVRLHFVHRNANNFSFLKQRAKQKCGWTFFSITILSGSLF